MRLGCRGSGFLVFSVMDTMDLINVTALNEISDQIPLDFNGARSTPCLGQFFLYKSSFVLKFYNMLKMFINYFKLNVSINSFRSLVCKKTRFQFLVPVWAGKFFKAIKNSAWMENHFPPICIKYIKIT